MRTTGETISSSSDAFDFSAFDGRTDRQAVRAFFDSDDPRIVQLEDLLAGRLRRLRAFAIVGVFAVIVGLFLYWRFPLAD